MGSKAVTLVCGMGLIIWACIPINEKPIDLHYQITATAMGTVMCMAAFAMIVQDNIIKHIDEKLKK